MLKQTLCENCGQMFYFESKFCPNCGKASISRKRMVFYGIAAAVALPVSLVFGTVGFCSAFDYRADEKPVVFGMRAGDLLGIGGFILFLLGIVWMALAFNAHDNRRIVQRQRKEK